MGYTRMFTAECDKCGIDFGAGYWYKSVLMERMKHDGWHVTNTTVTCDNCKR